MAEPKLSEVLERTNEVYSAVMWLTRLVIFLIGVIVVKLLSTALTHIQFVKMFRRINKVLDMVERHAGITDERAGEIKKQNVAALKGVAALIKSEAASIKAGVPAAVVDEMARKGGDSTEGELPTLGPLPNKPR